MIKINKDIFKKILHKNNFEFRMRENDKYHLFHGVIFWKIYDSTGKLRDSGSWENTVTLDASILVARLMNSPHTANLSEPKFGCYALAVGTGDVGWNLQSPPIATNTQRSLYNEICRKQIATTEFINGSGAISGIPTNIVDFTTNFAAGEAVGALVEMGIIGGDMDTILTNTNPILPPNGIYDPTVNVTGKDTLINYKTFKVKNIGPLDTFSFTWRLTF